MKKIIMKKIILSAAVLLLAPMAALGAGSWATREEGSQFFIEGDCSASVKIEFFAKKEDSVPAFAENLDCAQGRFSFSSDLSRKKLAMGNYLLAVDGQKSHQSVSVKNDKAGAETTPAVRQAQTAEADPDTKFLKALGNFEQSILDMKEWIAQTKYSGLVKNGVDSTLDGIMALSGKIADLLWSADSGSESVPEKQPEAPEENAGESIQEIPENPISAGEPSAIEGSGDGNGEKVTPAAVEPVSETGKTPDLAEQTAVSGD